MTTTDLDRLDRLVGDWVVTSPSADGPAARCTFAWALDRAYLLQRSEPPVPGAPTSLALIGVDGDAYRQHYFDSRGVARLYRMTFDGARWTLLRETPDFSPLHFHQRFTATVDTDVIDGAWEISHDAGTTWDNDFALVYRRMT